MLKRQTQKILAVILFCAVPLSTLFGCAGDKTKAVFTPIGIKTEAEEKNSSDPRDSDEICADLIQGKFLGSNIIIDELEILKRQTRPEEYSDTVYVTVSAHDEQRKFYRGLELDYTLYNEGWILDYVIDNSEGNYWAEPLVGPDYSLVDQYFNDYNSSHLDENDWKYDPPYSSWTVVNETFDLPNRAAYIEISAKRELPLWETDETITLAFSADPYSGLWEGIPPEEYAHCMKLDFSKACNVTYYGSQEAYGRSYWAELTILGVDYENKLITVECSMESSDWQKDYSGTYSFTQINDEWKNTLTIQSDNGLDLSFSPHSIWFNDIEMYYVEDN